MLHVHSKHIVYIEIYLRDYDDAFNGSVFIESPCMKKAQLVLSVFQPIQTKYIAIASSA